MPIRKAFYKKGFSESPALLWQYAASGVFPSIKHTAFESVQYTAGSSRYRASTRYTVCKFYKIITLCI